MGCTEHVTVISEIIKHIKAKKKTVHIAFFDLADAFGSVPHDTIFHAFERNNFPHEIQVYIRQYYSQVKSCVVTKSFRSDIFQFKKGVTQGDPLSTLIFILTFQPILDNIKTEETYGIEINGKLIITLPYADDFSIINQE